MFCISPDATFKHSSHHSARSNPLVPRLAISPGLYQLTYQTTAGHTCSATMGSRDLSNLAGAVVRLSRARPPPSCGAGCTTMHHSSRVAPLDQHVWPHVRRVTWRHDPAGRHPRGDCYQLHHITHCFPQTTHQTEHTCTPNITSRPA